MYSVEMYTSIIYLLIYFFKMNDEEKEFWTETKCHPELLNCMNL